MFVALVFIILIVCINGALVLARIKPRALFVGHCVLALSIMGVCALKENFDLGPHIEVAGWLAGLIIGAVSLVCAFVAVGLRQLFVGFRPLPEGEQKLAECCKPKVTPQ